MQIFSSLLVMAALASLSGGTLAASSRQADEDAVRHLQTLQAEAWNHHDATAYAMLFSEQGDVVNVLGWWWQGRKQIQSKLAAAFTFVFRDSVLTITDVNVRFLARDIAIAHVRWTMTGAKAPPGQPPPREGIQLQVLRKKGADWQIESFQNTNSVPEQPFPSGPPT